MSNLAAAYMARRYAKGGKVHSYANGGEVITEAEKLKKALQSPMGGLNLDKETEEYLPPAPKKMAMGGMIEDEMDGIEESGDMDEEMAEMDSSEMTKKSRLLTKILTGMRKIS